MSNKLLIGLLLILLCSCGEDQALTKKWYYLSDELRVWAVDDSSFVKMTMLDRNNITREFVVRNNENDFSWGSASFAGIKYEVSHTEYYYQNMVSNYGDNYSFYLNASFDKEEFGESMRFYFNDLNFEYEFLLEEITRLEVNSFYESLPVSSAGIETDKRFKSSCEIIETLKVRDSTYAKVFHFQLNDFQEHWTELTVTDIYYAQKVGLISYKLNNGLIVGRENQTIIQ